VAEHLVSVVVPVRDGASYLREALESVLAQTGVAHELIVVDDGSEDGSGELARAVAPEATVITQRPQGDAAARNRGVQAAVGSHLAFLDSDDLWPAGKLALQMAVMKERPEAHLVFGHQHQFRSEELSGGQRFKGEGEVRPAPTWGTLLMERETLDRVGPFSSEQRIGSFMDWLTRARDAGCIEVMLDDVLLHRRLHPKSLTATSADSGSDYAHVLKGVIERRRAR
jgi:glycosyltransferase involved in cell wall biosynthesis